MSDPALLRRMTEFSVRERGVLAESLACLAEVDRRKAYADLEYPNAFAYCVGHLRYSEACAYRRLAVARAADVRTEIYADLKSGELTLCVAALIASEMSGRDAEEVLAAARGKSKRQVEAWLAARRPPAPALPDRVRVAPPVPIQAGTAGLERAGTGNGVGRSAEGSLFSVALGPAPAPTYQYAFTASASLHRAIERLKDILWNRIPSETLDDYLHEAIDEYLERNDPELRFKAAVVVRPSGPRSSSRRVPAAVRDAVWARDGGRCAFVSGGGSRCACRRGLELDHVVPYSRGGRSDDPANVRLLCREHNQRERRRQIGEGTGGDIHRFSPGRNAS